MAEYIDLNETIIDFGFEWDDIAPTRDEFINFLKSRKRANVKEIVYAHWIEEKEHLYLANGICKEWMNFYCSKCDTPSPAPTQYCPHCGAEMSEVK